MNNKIIDCFLFYNELELLDYRLNILNQYVDYFVIIESTHTFIGKEKRLYFNENKSKFKSFEQKIIHIIVNDMPFIYPNIDINKRNQWDNEIHQRNCINRGIECINNKLNNNDIIIISDVDEVPDPSILLHIKNVKNDIGIISLEMDMYYYNLSTKLINKWYAAKLVSYLTYKNLSVYKSIEEIRGLQPIQIKNGGWHLSYFGDNIFIQNKIMNFSHQEYNNEQYLNLDTISKKIKDSSDLFDRGYEPIMNIDINKNQYLPTMWDKYLIKYSN
jgi:beta-1,4-mannosyl-glycoprotein beta-1,4-N-acetylglucosaminyltransferase